ncbi:MAG: hypothetical protein CMB80_05905 [Flammeovirgaceae bacterium]|nr:hypothetical protein [Flammeovirgaceae bacterium]
MGLAQETRPSKWAGKAILYEEELYIAYSEYTAEEVEGSYVLIIGFNGRLEFIKPVELVETVEFSKEELLEKAENAELDERLKESMKEAINERK